MDMKLINKTPHALHFVLPDGSTRTIEPTPPAARVTMTNSDAGMLDGIPVSTTIYGEVKDLPDHDEDTIYIVSGMVISALPERKDLYRPDSGPDAVRDEAGKIVAVRRLVR